VDGELYCEAPKDIFVLFGAWKYKSLSTFIVLPRLSVKHLFCSMEERKSYRVRKYEGYDDKIVVYPLNNCEFECM